MVLGYGEGKGEGKGGCIGVLGRRESDSEDGMYVCVGVWVCGCVGGRGRVGGDAWWSWGDGEIDASIAYAA